MRNANLTGKTLPSRRNILQAAAMAVSPIFGQDAPDWGGNVIDVHLHFRPGVDTNLEHMRGCGVTHAVLLTRAQDEAKAKETVAAHPKRYVRFAAADVTKTDGVEILRKAAGGGAIGFGEIKYHLAVNSVEMRRLYDLAAELNVPVLIHFADVPQFEGEGTFTSPFSGLEAMLKAHKKTTFIGHADGFWANVSAGFQNDTPYPTGKIKPGGLTDKMLSDYPNLYGDMSANSGRNALGRDPEFMTGFVKRHQNKLMFGSDCSCSDGRGKGQGSKQPLIAGKCVARETLGALKQITTPDVFKKVTFNNAVKLLKIKF
jgi:uncharacterized protein